MESQIQPDSQTWISTLSGRRVTSIEILNDWVARKDGHWSFEGVEEAKTYAVNMQTSFILGPWEYLSGGASPIYTTTTFAMQPKHHSNTTHLSVNKYFCKHSACTRFVPPLQLRGRATCIRRHRHCNSHAYTAINSMTNQRCVQNTRWTIRARGSVDNIEKQTTHRCKCATCRHVCIPSECKRATYSAPSNHNPNWIPVDTLFMSSSRNASPFVIMVSDLPVQSNQSKAWHRMALRLHCQKLGIMNGSKGCCSRCK